MNLAYRIDLVKKFRDLLYRAEGYATYNDGEKEDPENGYQAYNAEVKDFESWLEDLQMWIPKYDPTEE